MAFGSLYMAYHPYLHVMDFLQATLFQDGGSETSTLFFLISHAGIFSDVKHYSRALLLWHHQVEGSVR